MYALILDGSLESRSLLKPISRSVTDELTSRGWDVEAAVLHQMDIKSCIGCFRCWDTTPGICTGVKGDEADAVIRKAIVSELLVFLTPLTFGGYSSELKKIIERFLGLLLPGMGLINGESHHLKRYDRYPSVLSLAVSQNPLEGEIALFKKLAHRHSLNFHPPVHRAEVFSPGDPDIREKLGSIIDKMELTV